MKIGRLLIGFAFISLLYAQTPMRVASITAVGQASVSVTPDLALVDVGVSTQAATAQDASQQNAAQAGSIISALQALLGTTATIKTISYSVSPVYNTGQNATIIGYVVTNIVEVRLTDLTLVGKVIDTAIQSGANRVQGVSFGVQDNTAPVAQALKTAASSARSQANAIASGLNVQTGAVLHASEGVNTANPTILAPSGGGAGTPIQTGMVVIQASVTIEVAITP
jgi:uncharacterized protein YggE